MAKRKNLSKSVRFEVFKRDSFKCQYCGKSAPDVVLEVDHIIPVSKGGDNDISNLITACFDCNRGKRDKKLTDKQSVKLQKEELDKLNARREQIEMIAEWRKELSNLMNESIDKIVEIINQEFYLELNLTDYERRNFSKRIKKYGVKETLNSSLIAFERYDDIETALSKIDGILYMRKLEEYDPEKAAYVRLLSLVKRRFNYFNYKVAYCLIDKLYANGYDEYYFDEELITKLIYSCSSWSEFKRRMEAEIEKYYEELEREGLLDE